LSERERLVLYGMVRFPQEPDSTIAKYFDMPQPTFSNIRRRLRKQGYFKVVGIPHLDAFCCEMISALHGSYNPIVHKANRDILEKNLESWYPEIFYTLRGVNKVLLLVTAKDFVTLNTVVDEIEARYLDKGVLEKGGLTRVDFPLQTSLISRFFDYSQALYDKFGLEDKIDTGLAPEPQVKPSDAKKTREIELSRNEARVIAHMFEAPDASEGEIAMHLKLSRTTVSKIRAMLCSEAIFRRLVIPNISMVGFELFVYAHSKFNPETTVHERLESTKWLMKNLPVTLSMVTNKEASTFFAVENYHALQEMQRLALHEYKAKGFIVENPEIIGFSMQEIRDNPAPRFAPIVKKVMHL
jgi:DNA-binding MarR family transcriptional regulator